jgi:hypothetical protein
MSYTLKGVLQGRLGPDDVEPIADATVKIYHLPLLADPPTAPGDSFSILRLEEEQAKAYLLFGMTRTDERGEFTIDLSEPSVARPGIPQAYAGGPVQVDVYCRVVAGQKHRDPMDEVQFALGTVQPEWREADGGRVAEFHRSLDEREWGMVRTRLDAWVVSGRVVSADGRLPQPRLKVHVFDADLLQDDTVGTAITDEEGRFRIDYAARDFKKTGVPGVDFEVGGPDLYFRIETEDGRLLIDEKKAAASQPGRHNVEAVYFTEIPVHPGAAGR